MRLSAESVTEIVYRVVGHIGTIGEYHYDMESLYNVPAFKAVCDYVANRLEDASDCKKAVEATVQVVSAETLEAAEHLIDTCEQVKRDNSGDKLCPWCYEPMIIEPFHTLPDGKKALDYCSCPNCGASAVQSVEEVIDDD